MAVEGVGNLAQNLTGRLFGPGLGQGSAVHTVAPLGARDIGESTATEDTFTPSTQENSSQGSAQEPRIFTPSQLELTTTTANILLAQAGYDTNPALFPSQASSTGATASGGAPSSGGTNAEQIIASPAATAQVQNEIHTLNASLPALGLTNNEIEQIDRIASLIKDFNPTAYADLVSQFEALAQQAGQQDAAGAPAASASGSADGTSIGSNVNGPRFHAQGMLLHLTDSQAAANGVPSGGAQNSAINAVSFNAAAPRQSAGSGATNSQGD